MSQFTVRVFFTDGSKESRTFKKVESAKAWLHGQVGTDLSRTINFVESTGPNLAELEAEDFVAVAVTPEAAVRESMPEPDFGMLEDGEVAAELAWEMKECQAEAEDDDEILEPTELSEAKPAGDHVVWACVGKCTHYGEDRFFDQEKGYVGPIARTHWVYEDTLEGNDRLAWLGRKADESYVFYGAPDGSVLRGVARELPDGTYGVPKCPACEKPVLVDRPEPKPEPPVEVPSVLVCPKCGGKGETSWVRMDGSKPKGFCFRCAAQYKPEELRGSQSAEDLRRNRLYDLTSRRAEQAPKVKLRLEVEGRKVFQEYLGSTEIFVSKDQAVRALDVTAGMTVIVASSQADDPKLYPAKVVEVVQAAK